MSVEEVVVPEGAAPEVTLTEHEQAMVDVVDNKAAEVAGQVDPENAPEYVEPEETPEIDYKAEYEKLLSEKDTPIPEEEEPEETPEETPEVVEDEGLVTPEVLGKYIDEFNGDGITDESYAEAKAAGYSKAVVDNYVAGQAAIAAEATREQNQRVFEKTGGPEEYNKMISWAKDSMTPEEITEFNSQVNSGDNEQIMLGVDSLTEKYRDANPVIPKRALKGSGPQGNPGPKGYENQTEMFKAMRHPSYGKDAAYTQSVAKRVGLSQF